MRLKEMERWYIVYKNKEKKQQEEDNKKENREGGEG